MTNEDKETRIRPWIDPEERVTVQFLDAPDLNATVTDCSDQLVDLSIETPVPHMTQNISVPLSQVEVAEDVSHLHARSRAASATITTDAGHQ